MLCVGYATSPKFWMEVTGIFTCQELGHMPKIETFVSILHQSTSCADFSILIFPIRTLVRVSHHFLKDFTRSCSYNMELNVEHYALWPFPYSIGYTIITTCNGNANSVCMAVKKYPFIIVIQQFVAILVYLMY